MQRRQRATGCGRSSTTAINNSEHSLATLNMVHSKHVIINWCEAQKADNTKPDDEMTKLPEKKHRTNGNGRGHELRIQASCLLSASRTGCVCGSRCDMHYALKTRFDSIRPKFPSFHCLSDINLNNSSACCWLACIWAAATTQNETKPIFKQVYFCTHFRWIRRKK